MVQQDGLSTLAGQVEGMLCSILHKKKAMFNLNHFSEMLNRICFVCYSYGSGSRIKLAYTRKIIDAIHSGSLLKANYKKTKVFGLEIPTEVEGVPSEILDPVNTVSSLFIFLHISITWPYFGSLHSKALF